MVEKLKGYIVTAVVAIGIILSSYLKGRSDQKSNERGKKYDALKKGAEVDQKVSTMSKSSLDGNLNRWMRD